jgi:hypothetical protein
VPPGRGRQLGRGGLGRVEVRDRDPQGPGERCVRVGHPVRRRRCRHHPAGPDPQTRRGRAGAAHERARGRSRVLGQVGQGLGVHLKVGGHEQQRAAGDPGRPGGPGQRVQPGREVRRRRVHLDRDDHCGGAAGGRCRRGRSSR